MFLHQAIQITQEALESSLMHLTVMHCIHFLREMDYSTIARLDMLDVLDRHLGPLPRLNRALFTPVRLFTQVFRLRDRC